MSDGPIMAFGKWKTNAELIVDVAKLGYLHADWLVLDATYGKGTFWKKWRPERLVTNDLHTEADHHFDFTSLPFTEGAFDAVVFDPPYKLNGTPSAPDQRYGVGEYVRWRDRMRLILDGVRECVRVVKPGGVLLVKCQDQVVSGAVRWQSIEVVIAACMSGCRLVDRFDFPSYRPQPKGRRQVHASRNTSQLLVFKREVKR